MLQGECVSLEFTAMVFIWIEVWSYNHAIAELSSSKRLLCLLAIDNRIELNEHLQNWIE